MKKKGEWKRRIDGFGEGREEFTRIFEQRGEEKKIEKQNEKNRGKEWRKRMIIMERIGKDKKKDEGKK